MPYITILYYPMEKSTWAKLQAGSPNRSPGPIGPFKGMNRGHIRKMLEIMENQILHYMRVGRL